MTLFVCFQCIGGEVLCNFVVYLFVCEALLEHINELMLVIAIV